MIALAYDGAPESGKKLPTICAFWWFKIHLYAIHFIVSLIHKQNVMWLEYVNDYVPFLKGRFTFKRINDSSNLSETKIRSIWFSSSRILFDTACWSLSFSLLKPRSHKLSPTSKWARKNKFMSLLLVFSNHQTHIYKQWFLWGQKSWQIFVHILGERITS